MSVITISRGSYSHGKEIAEKVAHKLGYGCISRDILIEASRDFNIPEIKLFHAIHDAPSMWDRILFRKEKYIAYIQAAVLKNLKDDNVVYHGFAGHFFVKEVAHVLRVRIIADMEERVKIVMKRNRVSREEAIANVHKLDEQRKKWSQQLYGIKSSDPSLYDMVIHIDKITVDDAVDIICHKIGLRRFQTTPESQQKIDDLNLAAQVKASLIDLKPDVRVAVQNGSVRITTSASAAQKLKLEEEMRKVAGSQPGIKNLQFDTRVTTPYAID
jgi:cytidylate kinase